LYVNRSVIDLDGEGLIRLESGEALNDLKSKNCSVRIAPALLLVCPSTDDILDPS